MIRKCVRFLPGLAAALLSAGCQDDLASPTRGFIEVDTGGVSNVQVFLDGVPRGVDVGTIGPIDAGTYDVLAVREGFVADPAGGVQVEVRPAETARARFTLVAVEFGFVDVRAADELTGAEVRGAEILRREAGDYIATGLVTPAVLSGLPVGPVEVLVRGTDYAEASVTVAVASDDTARANVELGPLRKVLAEMFTYVTCPNCPESADTLQAIQATRPGRVFVVEWHTLSPLPLYDPRWVSREAAYGGGAAWPSVVLQGGYADTPPLLVGSQTSNLLEYRRRADAYLAECEGGCDYALASDAVQGGGAMDIEAWVKWRAGPPRGSLVLRFVVVQREVVLGPRLFDDVPRDYAERAVSFAAPGEIQELTVSFLVNPLWGELDYVVYLQSDATLEILAVDGTS